MGSKVKCGGADGKDGERGEGVWAQLGTATVSLSKMDGTW
jgi:hypothetical protein